MFVRQMMSGLLAFAFVACTVLPAEEPKKADGAVCVKSGECGSEQCLGDVCQGRGCKTVSDCNTGWTCAHFDGSSGLFSSSSAFNACRAPCSAPCPEHHTCATGDDYCKPEPGWAQPRLTVPATVSAEPGSSVTLHADVISPVNDPAIKLSWGVPTDDPLQDRRIDGADATFVTPQKGGNVYRADVHAEDSQLRRNDAHVEIIVCGRIGDRCADGTGSDGRAIPCCIGAGTCKRENSFDSFCVN